MNKSWSFGCMLVLVALVGCETLPRSGGAGNLTWRNLSGLDFPARVRAINFSSGNVLDRGHSITWGRWTAKLKPQGSVAEYRIQGPPIDNTAIDIPLFCKNPVKGEKICMMSFFLHESPVSCYLFIGFPGPLEKDIRITCPSRLELK